MLLLFVPIVIGAPAVASLELELTSTVLIVDDGATALVCDDGATSLIPD